MGLIYDPPSGWRYGFPKPYKPLSGETLEETLLRDGYPQAEIDQGGAKHCRFLGSREELDEAMRAQRSPSDVSEGVNPEGPKA